MHIVFLAKLSLPFSPLTRERDPLGGSESALYYLSKELAHLGDRVTVINHCGKEAGEYEGVRYFEISQKKEWGNCLRQNPAEVLVIFRRYRDIFKSFPCKLKVFWAHDHLGVFPENSHLWYNKLAMSSLRAGGKLFNSRVDLVAVVSKWLGECFREYLRIPERKIFVTRNGIEVSYYKDLKKECDPYRLIYTSIPKRGLTLLLEKIFPEVKKQIPRTELRVFSYRSLEEYRHLSQPGVYFGGGLSQKELARELARSSLHLYPAIMVETSCIAAIEAQAAGIPVITSKRHALPETVVDGETGILIEGEPGSSSYNNRFIEATVNLLYNSQLRTRLGEAARKRALSWYRWDAIAREWHKTLEDRIQLNEGKNC